MEVITLQSEAYKGILDKIDNLEKKVEGFYKKSSTPLEEKWLDNQDVCRELRISKRTLQQYRTDKILPYSQIGSKIFYKASDIDAFLKSHYQGTN